MDNEIRKAVAEMPEKSRSKLEPHADVIRELRRKGRTYEDIANFFAERFDLKVAPSTITRLCECARDVTIASESSCHSR